MPLQIIRQDITKMKVDAIVNAANCRLRAGGGVCGAIFAAAGKDKLQKACDEIGYCNTGEAVITPGFGLPAKYVIHTAGPIFQDGDTEQERQLYNCYFNSLNLACKKLLKSVAFPLISSGIYGYPKSEALKVARDAISDFLQEHEMDVYLVIYDKDSFAISRAMFSDIQSYIDENLVVPQNVPRRLLKKEIMSAPTASYDSDSYWMFGMPKSRGTLEDLLEHIDESFSQMLLRLIDEKNLKDSEVYKKANIDRKLFSKIRSNVNYKPSKVTVIAFAIALELSLDETKDMLMTAGFALSHSNKFDIIIEYFIRNGNYNIFEINEALFAFDQCLLGV